MAAAEALVDAVRTKGGVRQRTRSGPGGAFGHESAALRGQRLLMLQARDREADKLDETERAELLFLWSGVDASLGCRSIQGAIYDRLLRSPPHTGMALQDAVEQELLKHHEGVPRDKLIVILVSENVGATPHEARQVLREMEGSSPPRIESFNADVVRKKECKCRASAGAYEHEGETHQVLRIKRPCTCGSGVEEALTVTMVKLVSMRDRKVPPTIERPHRWAREDASLAVFWQQIPVHESDNVQSGKLPAHVPEEATARARRAMRRLFSQDREVIERVYGPMTAPPWTGQLTPEAARLAPICPSTERARKELVAAQALARGLTSSAARSLDRSVFAADALHWKLDQPPEGELLRIRWKIEAEALKGRIEGEATALLKAAVKAFREAYACP